MTTFFKRFTSLFLSISMLTSLIPTHVFALDAPLTEQTELESFVQPESSVQSENSVQPEELVDAYSMELFAETFDFSTLTGKVTDSDGAGVPGVSVLLYNIEENEALSLCTTNTNGVWQSAQYDVIADYTYVIRYYKAGYTFSQNNVFCTAYLGGTTVATVTADALGNLVCNPDDYSYKVSNETVTITSYNGTDTSIHVPDTLDDYPVVAIGDNAFKQCTGLESVSLPNTLQTIGRWAFSGCANLETVELPDTVNHIGAEAFLDCAQLTDINYPMAWDSVTTWNGGQIFRGCTSLTDITVPEGVTTIPAYAFDASDCLQSVSLPSTLKTIKYNAFSRCTALESITIPAGVATLEDSAFNGCSLLKTISMSEGLESIGRWAFENCTSLETVELPDSVNHIGALAFADCTSLTDINFPLAWASVTTWNGGQIFKGCTSLISITVPEGVATIPAYAFDDSDYLQSVQLPSTLVSIDYNAFSRCTALETVTVPTGVTSLEDNAFSNCTLLKTISLPEGLESIGRWAFENCTSLETVDLPDTVNHIGALAFADCTGLTDINYPLSWDSVTTWNGGQIFKGCTSLTSITVPEGVTSIPAYAFDDSDYLQSVKLPSTLKTIEYNAFARCTALETVTVPTGVTSLEDNAFSNCTLLKTISLPEGLTSIGRWAFENCTKLETVKLPDTVNHIGASAFAGCTKLSEINYPLAWESVSTWNGGQIFKDCTALTNISIPEGVTSIPAYAFDDSDCLQSVQLPSTLESISNNAFARCSALRRLILPDQVQSLGHSSFASCSALERIWIPASVTTIENDAFQNHLAEFTIHGEEGSYAQTYAESNGIPFSTDSITADLTTLSGRVVDSSDQGVGDVLVQVYHIKTSQQVSVDLKTDTNGYWTMADLLVGETYLIRYFKSGYIFSENSIRCLAQLDGTTVDTVIATAPVAGELICNPADYSYTVSKETVTITKYNGTDTAIQMPDTLEDYPVVAIASSAFQGKTQLVTVALPNSVVSIGDNAFKDCAALESVYLPNSLTSIGRWAFTNCASLETVDLPDTVNHIGAEAFVNCVKLSDINYPMAWDSVSTWNGGQIFRGCTSLTSITIPEGVTSIPAYAFDASDCLQSVHLPSTLKTIEYNAFARCTALESITIPAGVTTLGDSAFNGCSLLKTVSMSEGLESIGRWAFENCTKLESVKLPDTVNHIGAEAFSGCVKLSDINYPMAWDSVTTWNGGQIFRGCTGLTSITIPEGVTVIPAYAFDGSDCLQSVRLPSTLKTIKYNAFARCTALESITIPAGVTTLEDSAFNGCSLLKTVSMSEGLTSIGRWAFENCTKLETVKLPDTVNHIGAEAFSDCEMLTDINYPLSWKSVSTWNGGQIFKGCSALTSITVPEGVTAIPAHAFDGADHLRTIHLPSTLETMGNNAFARCTNLRYASLPEGMQYVGDSCFRDCNRLRLLYLPDTITDYGSDVFAGCNVLTVECKEYSFATIYCIDNGIPVQFIDSTFDNSDHLALDRDNSYYIANMVGALANGYITMNLSYQFKPELSDELNHIRLFLRIPADMSLLEKTLSLDGNILSGYTLEDGLLTIELSKTAGRLSFCLKPTADSIVTTYAYLEFRDGNEEKREVLGIINEEMPILSIQSSDEINTPTLTVKGIGPADSDISILVDGTQTATARTNHSGSYSAQITIPAPENYVSYNLTATTVYDGKPISVHKEVQYCDSAPMVESFAMLYGGNTYNMLTLGNTKPIVTFDPAEAFRFQVKFSNPDQIDKVYICSTRSNAPKYLEASWDEIRQSYVASGFFDPTNKSYVPGTLTVQYSTQKEKLSFASGVDYTTEKYTNGASAPIKAMLKGKVKDCVEDLVSTDNTLSGVIKMVDINSQLDFNIMTDVLPSYLDPQNAGKYGYEVLTDDYGAQMALKVFEYGEDKVRGEIVDFAHEKITSFLIDGKYLNAASNVDSYFAFTEVLGYADTMITWDNNRISLNEARKAVNASSMSPAEKAAALTKLDYASKANHGVVAAMALQIILSAAGIALPFPANMVLPLLSLQNSNYVNDVLGMFGFLDASETDGAMFTFRWRIDPSGIVTDAVTGECLPGVTTTAYWIESDGSDDFLNTPPADDLYGTLWDATEWDQINPQITDAAGRYAWDVPEGWWRVKYEKDGYLTTWSEWLPVPPPQENVNVELVPFYSVTPDSCDSTSATFVLSNNSDEAITVLAIAAAYDSEGRMVALQTATPTLSASTSDQLTLSYEAANDVYTIKAFLLDASSRIPLCSEAICPMNP